MHQQDNSGRIPEATRWLARLIFSSQRCRDDARYVPGFAVLRRDNNDNEDDSLKDAHAKDADTPRYNTPRYHRVTLGSARTMEHLNPDDDDSGVVVVMMITTITTTTTTARPRNTVMRAPR